MRSDKFKARLIPIKRALMKEIASMLINGRFDMAKETVINYNTDSIVGIIPIEFDYVEGNELVLKFRKKSADFICQHSISDDDNINSGGEVMFLSRLLDYMDMDKREVRL